MAGFSVAENRVNSFLKNNEQQAADLSTFAAVE
jgi:hypothetical protein